MTRVIDAHHHYWGAATAVHPGLARDYGPEDLRPLLHEAGIDATVLVEAEDSAQENRRLAAYAAATPTVAGVVAYAPLRKPDLDAIGDAVGVRCLVGEDPLELDAGVFAELAARGLTWDIVSVTREQVDAVGALADAVPELRIVVDHLAAPPLAGGAWAPWIDALRALAARPNVALKLSVGIAVLTRMGSWDAGAVATAVGHALEHFGPERAMLASNWPVVLLRRGYADAWRDLRAAVPPEARDAVLGGTAARWYGITGDQNPGADVRPRAGR